MPSLFKTEQEVLDFIKKEKVQFVDFRFMDFIGIWQHCSYPAENITADTFKNGMGFDGSSIRGWQEINESDMIMKPVATTAFVDPFMIHKTLVMICNICDPIAGSDYSRDPRHVAIKAVNYVKSLGIADQIFFGPEAEFFIFNDIRFDQNSHEGYFHIDSDEGKWNTGRIENPNLGYKIRHKEGYFPVPPTDSLHDLRSEMVLNMHKVGLEVEMHHHEVATGGQCEIGIKFNTLVEMADDLLKQKYVVKNTAVKNNKTVTFMPKPLFGDNGSGMHCHFSMWKAGTNLFYGNGYAGLSETALHAIGGILKNAHSVLAFTNPTTNSYKRLVPGYEAPVNLAYSQRNRSAAVRIPMYSSSPKAKRIEFRCPDPSCNPYLAFAAITMAAVDGIQNKVNPGQPLDKNIYDLPAEEAAKVTKTTGSLRDSLTALAKNHAYLTKGDVFTQDVIDAWISYKMKHEVEAMDLRPHPHEFALYYDI